MRIEKQTKYSYGDLSGGDVFEWKEVVYMKCMTDLKTGEDMAVSLKDGSYTIPNNNNKVTYYPNAIVVLDPEL